MKSAVLLFICILWGVIVHAEVTINGAYRTQEFSDRIQVKAGHWVADRGGNGRKTA